jgi:hypothetical protein
MALIYLRPALHPEAIIIMAADAQSVKVAIALFGLRLDNCNSQLLSTSDANIR